MSIDLLLYILAFICFVLRAFGVASARVDLVALGLALFVLTFII